MEDDDQHHHHPVPKTKKHYNRQFSNSSNVTVKKGRSKEPRGKKKTATKKNEDKTTEKLKELQQQQQQQQQQPNTNIITNQINNPSWNHHNQLILIFKEVTKPPKGIFENLKKLGATSIQFHPHNRFCIVEFETLMVATDSLKRLRDQGYSAHRRLEIVGCEWQSLLAPLPQVPEEYGAFFRQHFYILDAKFGSKPADQQVREFLKRVEMSAEDYERAFSIVQKLQKILSFGKLYPFGSLLTRIGDKNSDVDLLFEDFETRPIPKVFQDIKRAIDSSGLEGGDGGDGSKIGEIDQILDDEQKIRVPLLRLVHTSVGTSNGHGLKFDISCGNVLGVQNSKLIQFLFSLDPLIRPLATFIRQWARFHCLKSHTSGLKNYAIVLLVLVFCFRKKILPTVQQLQSLELDSDQKPVLVAGIPAQDGEVWNVGFCDDEFKVKQFMKKRSIGIDRTKIFYKPIEILARALEFFAMIETIRPCRDVVSSLTGEFIEAVRFSPGNEQKLPPSQSRYVLNVEKTKKSLWNKNTCLYLQDPFDLSFNVACTCSHFIFKRFVIAARSTIQNVHSLSTPSGQKSTHLTLPPFFTPLSSSQLTRDHRKQLFKILKSEAALSVSSRLATYANEFGHFPYPSGPPLNPPAVTSSPISLVMEVDDQLSRLFMAQLASHETQYGHQGHELLTRFWYRALVQFFGGSGPPLDRVMGQHFVDRTSLRHVTSENLKIDGKEPGEKPPEEKPPEEKPPEEKPPEEKPPEAKSRKTAKAKKVVWLENLLKGQPPYHHKISFEFTIDPPNIVVPIPVPDMENDECVRNDLNNFLNFSCTIEYALMRQKNGEDQLVEVPRVTVIIRPFQFPFSFSNKNWVSPIKIAELIYGMNCSFQEHFTHFVMKELQDLIQESVYSGSISHSRKGQEQNQNQKPKQPKQQRKVKNNKQLDKNAMKRNNY